MMTTWQKMLVIFIGIVFGLIVGYICIKPHIEKESAPVMQNINTNDVFEQYLNSNENTNNNSNAINDNNSIVTNTIEKEQ